MTSGLTRRDFVSNVAIAVMVSLECNAAVSTSGTEQAPHAGRPWTLPLNNKTALKMAWIAPGTFIMGSPQSESLRSSDEGPTTEVTLTHGFWMGTTTVTIAQWQAVMGLNVRQQLSKLLHDDALYDFGGTQQTVRAYMHFLRDAAPDEYLTGEASNLPMYYISWNDAMEFCRRLNTRERACRRLSARYEYALPTEAQWEYASRAGTTSTTYADPLIIQDQRAPVLDDIAWYDANSADGYVGKGWRVAGHNAGPHPVAQKKPNAWGLYDMAGNIWQWCRDWYGPYPGGHVIDPVGIATGIERVNRGGSFGSGARDERSASRAKNPPAEASAFRGFRLALVVR